MTPLQVKHYAKQRKFVSVAMLSNHFKIDEALAESLLMFWLRKRSLIKMEVCGTCPALCETRYQWVVGV